MTRLVMTARVVKFKQGDFIYTQGKECGGFVFIVREGTVKLSTNIIREECIREYPLSLNEWERVLLTQILQFTLNYA
jgi:hypothetical protein